MSKNGTHQEQLDAGGDEVASCAQKDHVHEVSEARVEVPARDYMPRAWRGRRGHIITVVEPRQHMRALLVEILEVQARKRLLISRLARHARFADEGAVVVSAELIHLHTSFPIVFEAEVACPEIYSFNSACYSCLLIRLKYGQHKKFPG